MTNSNISDILYLIIDFGISFCCEFFFVTDLTLCGVAGLESLAPSVCVACTFCALFIFSAT